MPSDKYVYNEPRPGLTISGVEVTCNLEITCTKEDAIRMARYSVPDRHAEFTDDQMLDSFVCTHWAWADEREALLREATEVLRQVSHGGYDADVVSRAKDLHYKLTSKLHIGFSAR